MPSSLICSGDLSEKGRECSPQSLCVRLLGTKTFGMWTYNRTTILGVSRVLCLKNNLDFFVWRSLALDGH